MFGITLTKATVWVLQERKIFGDCLIGVYITRITAIDKIRELLELSWNDAEPSGAPRFSLIEMDLQ